MLDVSATQELAKNLDAEDVEIKELRAANEALAKKLADVEAAEKALQAKDAVREARLTKLETGSPPPETPPSTRPRLRPRPVVKQTRRPTRIVK